MPMKKHQLAAVFGRRTTATSPITRHEPHATHGRIASLMGNALCGSCLDNDQYLTGTDRDRCARRCGPADGSDRFPTALPSAAFDEDHVVRPQVKGATVVSVQRIVEV